jgi:hypothetical protein
VPTDQIRWSQLSSENRREKGCCPESTGGAGGAMTTNSKACVSKIRRLRLQAIETEKRRRSEGLYVLAAVNGMIPRAEDTDGRACGVALRAGDSNARARKWQGRFQSPLSLAKLASLLVVVAGQAQLGSPIRAQSRRGTTRDACAGNWCLPVGTQVSAGGGNGPGSGKCCKQLGWPSTFPGLANRVGHVFLTALGKP